MKLFSLSHIYIFFIFTFALLSLLLRIYGINWDSGFNLHPDERAIILFTLPLGLPTSIDIFFSNQSPLNPHFFAYGNFPLYLLKSTSFLAGLVHAPYATYQEMYMVGRIVSVLAELGTLFTLFLLAKKIFGKPVAILSIFFYTVSVLPIQLAHFYAVDTLLTFFILITLYQLINFYEKQTIKNALLVGVFFGLSLATKTSALVLLFSIGTAIGIEFLLIFLKQPHRPHVWFPHVPVFIKRLCIDGIIIVTTALATFAITEPYAFIDFSEFWKQNMQQAAMTHNAFTFPYTLQYVGKIPYLYELKNIFLFGLGPLLASLCFIGTFYVNYSALTKEKKDKWAHEIILVIFFCVYFLIIGNFAIGFMRYLLPLYPLLCLFGAFLAYRINRLLRNNVDSNIIRNTLYVILTTSLLVWPLSFLHIYTQPNTRILATDWIIKNIKAGSTIGIEHWDDSLPLTQQQNYHMETLELYNPDTDEKWRKINQQFLRTDYLILASNRLYTPLQKLTDCDNLPIGYCYTQTANYYKKLFDGSLGFKKVAEFAVYPTIPLLNKQINDQSADESFTVYDHPKIVIFQKSP